MPLKTRKEFSAGGVVYKRIGLDIKVVLIARKNKKVWCLPKGKIEKGESSEEAAKREIREETGLVAALKSRLGDVAYWFVSPQDEARVFKKVRFFLFEYMEGSVSAHDAEVDEARWFKGIDVLKIMTYPSEKEIMQKALEVINKERC